MRIRAPEAWAPGADFQPALEHFKVCGIVEVAAPVGVPPKTMLSPDSIGCPLGQPLGENCRRWMSFNLAIKSRLVEVVIDTLSGEVSVI